MSAEPSNLPALTLCGAGEFCLYLSEGAGGDPGKWRRCTHEGCDYENEWMHEKCWLMHHSRPKSKEHTFEAGEIEWSDEMQRQGIISRAQDARGVVLVMAQQGAAVGIGVPSFICFTRAMPRFFDPQYCGLPLRKALPKALQGGGAHATTAIVAGLFACYEIYHCYDDWAKAVTTRREFQVAVSAAIAGGVAGAGGSVAGGAGGVALAASSAAAGTCLATGGVGAAVLVVVCAVVGGMSAAGIGRMGVSKVVQMVQEWLSGSKYDEERELIHIILASKRMNLVQCQHPLTLTEQDLGSAWRRRAAQFHPDKNRLVQANGEADDKFANRLKKQRGQYDLNTIDWGVLNKFIHERDAGRWQRWETCLVDRWDRMSEVDMEDPRVG